MTTIVYRSEHATARLTTESPASHYGIPVLEITDHRPGHEGTGVYGWGDVLPSGVTGAEFVRLVAAGRPESSVDVGDPEVQAALVAAMANVHAMLPPPTPDDENDELRAQVDREIPRPPGGFGTDAEEDAFRARREARFIELVHAMHA